MGKVVIILGSKADLEHSKKITETLERLGVEYAVRIASAHKTPLKILGIIKEYEEEDVVFITVAGRSNTLSGFVDANTTRPVIACPPYSDKFGGMDILSSLRMPSGVCPLVILEPESAGLASVKILAITDKKLQRNVSQFQKRKKTEIEESDASVK
jgi:5-(carboxyamino)imidazole ribonucleotide mutase